MSSPPPPGTPAPTPEFLAEDIRSITRIGIVVVFVLAFIVVALRFYARSIQTKSFGLDDWLMVLSVGFAAAVMALCLSVLHHGAGTHIAAMQPAQLVVLMKHVVALQLVYHIGLWVLRLSGLAFYARLWKNADRSRVHMMIASAFVTAVAVAQVLILALQCIPLKALWKDGPGQCLTQYAVFISTAAMTIVCDSLVLLIPLRIIWRLKMNLRRKIALGLVLLFGVLTSVVRIIQMVPAVTKSDPTWYYAPVVFWSCMEMTAAMIALSAPALKPLFGKWIQGTTAGSRDPSGFQRGKTPSALSGLRSSSYNLKSFGSSKPPSNDRTIDSGSIEKIIGDDVYAGDETGIRKTVEVRVKEGSMTDHESSMRTSNGSQGLPPAGRYHHHRLAQQHSMA